MAAALFAVAAGPAVGQETHDPTLTVSSYKSVMNTHGVTPLNPLGLDLLVTGPTRTSAPTSFADALGTTVAAGSELEVAGGASARLAGTIVLGALDIHGAADTLFSYTSGSGGPVVERLADLHLVGGSGSSDGTVLVEHEAGLEVGDYAASGGDGYASGSTDVRGTLTVGGDYAATGGAGINSSDAGVNGSLSARSVRLNEGADLTIFNGGTVTVAERLTVNGGLEVLSGGALVMTPGAVLGGSGTFTTGTPWMLGTVAPGNSPGTMSFASGIATDANTRLEIELVPTANPVAGTDNDLIAVTGTATIDGGTVVAQRWGAGDYTLGTEYTFLTADDLVVNQAFGVVSDVAGVGFASAFTAGPNGTYRLIVSRVADPLSVARTFNQRSAGAALTALGSGPLLAAFNAAPTDAARRELVSDLSGELFPTLLTARVQDAARFQDHVTAQTFGAPWSCANCGGLKDAGLTGWLAGYGAGGRVNGDGNGRTAEVGVGGTAVGLSRCFGNLSAGGFYGFESGTVRVPGADSSVTTDTHRVGGWGRADAGLAYLRTAAHVGFGESDSRRTFPTGASGAAFGEFDAVTSAAEVETGLRLGGAAAYLVPAVGLRYVHADQDGFAERGGVAALDLGDSSLSALRARLGVRAGATLPGMPVTGTLSTFYSRDLNASAVGDVDAAFLAGGPAFRVRGTDFARDRVDLGPGVVIGTGPVKVVADYRAGLTESSVEHAGGARLEVCF